MVVWVFADDGNLLDKYSTIFYEVLFFVISFGFILNMMAKRINVLLFNLKNPVTFN